MEITRPTFPSPIICIDDFLSADEAESVLAECVALEPHFSPASIVNQDGSVQTDTKFRSNDVLFLRQLEHLDPPRRDVNRLVRTKVWSPQCKAIWHEGEFIFDIINYSNFQSATISRFGDAKFFKGHRDTIYTHITRRLVTLVYYVNQEPRPFEGGALILSKAGEQLAIEPRHNRAILFPSFTMHEVAPVQLLGDNWADGRFSINYWFGFR